MKNAAERRLSAIVSADIVGYSKLMGIDEYGTLEAMRLHRAELIDPAVERYGGHIVKTTGDGLLIEFPSAVNGTKCAADIQRDMATRQTGISKDRQIIYRIGVNLGDIIHEDGDIFGDGVNVAARIEALADPGGVFISGSIFEQISGKCDLEYQDLGQHQVKNIAQPVHVYRVVLGSTQSNDVPNRVPARMVGTGAGASKKKYLPQIAGLIVFIFVAAIFAWYQPWRPAEIFISDNTASQPIDAKPSIAVLPFLNMSGDKEQNYFVDGMSEDLITDLSKISALTVISRTSSFAYRGKSPDIRDIAKALNVQFIVEGSVRKIGNKIRVTAQLIEAETGKHLWAERYDRELANIFAVQDEVRAKIVSVLEIKLTSGEKRRLARSLTQSPKAYDLYLKGLQQESFFTKASNHEAQQYYLQATQIDPSFASAFAHLAQMYSYVVENSWAENPQNYIKLAFDAANSAIELDDELPYAYWSLGRILTREYRPDLARAISLFEKAIELNPNYADGYVYLANAYIFDGRAEKAFAMIEKGMKFNPFIPFWYHQALGMARFFLGNYEAAIRSFEKTIEQNSTFPAPYRFSISSYGHLGQNEEAEWMVEEYESLGRSSSIKKIMQSASLRNPAYRKIYEDGLRKAGLAEE